MSRFLHPQYAGLEAYTPGSSPGPAIHQTQHQRVPLPPRPGGAGGPDGAGPGRPAAVLRPGGHRPAGQAGRRLYGVEAGAGFPLQRVGRYFKLRFHGLRGRRGGVPRPDLQLYPVFANLHGVAYETVPSGRTPPPLDVAGMQGRGNSPSSPTPTPPPGSPCPWTRWRPSWLPTPTMWWWWTRPTWTSGADSAVPPASEV